jgi:protein tyrosine phosphatase (PTP) superfamily phosphohydrolase (DUF442 family)
LNSIRNFVQLRKNIGTSGQPTSKQFKLIADAGYEHVVNLATPDHPDSIPNEGQIVTQQGMSYTHIPVPFDAPLPKHVKHFCGIMSILSTEQIFVHCIMNYRVSAFMFHFLSKIEGCSDTESKSEIFDLWVPDKIWKNLLKLTTSEIGL